jgi:sensor histidine kinase regulating citrate/malate metabolism
MPLTLRAKLNLWSVFNALVGLALVAAGFSYVFVQSQFQEKGEQALRIAEMVASMPEVIEAFHTQNPPAVLQPLTQRIQDKMGTQFIVVANMQRVRYSHPNVREIGQKMQEADNDDAAVLRGQTSVTEAVGTLGLSIRGKAPIFDGQGHQIGFVSVGFLVRDIWRKVMLSLVQIAGLGLGGLLLSAVGAHLVSGHVKRQIFGMEPAEIAHLVKEQSAILQSIKEGILAVDKEGRITACNDEARRILNVQDTEMVGRYITEVIPYERLCSVITSGSNFVDQPMVIGNTLIVANRVSVRLHNAEIGAVLTFRDKLQLDQVEHRLKDIERYADDLRSQRHEFMNRLHTISGLIQLKEYDLACALIDQINEEQNQLLSFFAHKIRDPAILGLIVGKMHRARESGIRLDVDAESEVSETCAHREIVITVLGNAVDNAVEAIQSHPDCADPQITVLVKEEPDSVILTVRDTGPGIDPMLGERIFEDGVTTKGPGRGLGLSICAQMVAGARGQLSIRSSSAGATLQMILPRGEQVEET